MAKSGTTGMPGLFDNLPEQEQIARIALDNWREHLKTLGALDKRIERLMDDAVKKALVQGRKLTSNDIGRIFQSHPEMRAALDKAIDKLNADLTAAIEQGSKEAWLRANAGNDAVITAMAAGNAQLASLFAAGQNKPQNDRALRAFQQREMQGMKLSDRVWKSTVGMKRDMERAIEVALAEGVPAQKLSQRVRQLLREPNRLYRRVRDKDGNLKLSQAAQKYHPGAGVYRSSYKNAMRVARTEVNMAYQASDSERWKSSWWVKGIRISLSNNHTCLDSKGKPAPLFDICDELAGDYPADFKFTGWHPQCRCFATAITCDYADIRDYYRRKRAGEDMSGYTPPGAITEPPMQFKRWLENNADRLGHAAARGTTPYFIINNSKYTGRGIINNQETIKIGNQTYSVNTLIDQSAIIETINGKVYLHPGHGRTERVENIEIATFLAEKRAEEIILLPNPEGIKSADSYNITRGALEEYKRNTTPTIGAIDNELRSGVKQAGVVLIDIKSEIRLGDLRKSIQSRVCRTDISEVRLILNGKIVTYRRNTITSQSFEIKPDDFK